jgi:hypothetical protein
MQLTSLITPSPSWLAACQSHLGSHNANNNDDESIWNQILHSDLRNVVNFDGNNNLSASRLRACIAQSTVANDGKATFELTTPHMVQIEEIVDVSLNSEGMLGGNNSSGGDQTNGNNNGGQNNNHRAGRSSSRMLKLVISDGYNNPTNNNNSTMLAMETSNIPSLTSNTAPGTKLLLFSNNNQHIIIRRGIIQLTAENCLVLGGKIAHWEMLAKEKRERMKRAKGMDCADATVRALIWCNDDNLDGE